MNMSLHKDRLKRHLTFETVVTGLAEIEATVVERPPTNTVKGRMQAMFL